MLTKKDYERALLYGQRAKEKYIKKQQEKEDIKKRPACHCPKRNISHFSKKEKAESLYLVYIKQKGLSTVFVMMIRKICVAYGQAMCVVVCVNFRKNGVKKLAKKRLAEKYANNKE